MLKPGPVARGVTLHASQLANIDYILVREQEKFACQLDKLLRLLGSLRG